MEYLLLGALLILGLAAIAASRTVVRPWERVVIFRAGRPRVGDVRGPGVAYLLPILDQPVRIDMRDQSLRIDRLAVTPGNGSKVSVTIDLRWRVVDPWTFAIQVVDMTLRVPVEAIAQRLVAGPTSGDQQTLSARIEADLRAGVARLGAEVLDLRVETS